MKFDIEAKLSELGPLKFGNHDGPEHGASVMEAVSYVIGDLWSDRPQCVSPVIGDFLNTWNDALPSDEERDRLLRPLIPIIIDTRSANADDLRRSYMAIDWMARVFTPTWLRVAKLHQHAAALEKLAPIVDCATALAAAPVVARAKAGAEAAWTAAWAGTKSADRNAALAAQHEAAKLAWDAAQQAARTAVWAAAMDASKHADWDNVWSELDDARANALLAAALIAARDTAQNKSLTDAINATGVALQLSAVELVKRMVAHGEAR